VSRPDALQISSSQAGTALTPAQKRFNTLTRQIEQARQTLAAWQDNIAAYRQAHAEVLNPLQAELLAGHRKWVLALDAALDQPNWAKAERQMLRELLCEAAGKLLDGGGEDDPIRALFDKHAEVDYETEQRDALRVMKDLAEAMTGLDLGDDDGIDTDEDLHARLKRGFEERDAAERARRGAKATRAGKSAAKQRREAEAQQATQSVREIYRKLASALHPDRETDEAQRPAKTALMQRVNQAYEARDLLALLQLQLQIEQIDESHIANAGEQRLKHYNKVLGEQLAELHEASAVLQEQYAAQRDELCEDSEDDDVRLVEGFVSISAVRLPWDAALTSSVQAFAAAGNAKVPVASAQDGVSTQQLPALHDGVRGKHFVSLLVKPMGQASRASGLRSSRM